MRWSSLKRALDFGGRPPSWWTSIVAGAAAALLVALLLVMIGLIAALLDQRSLAAYIDAQPAGIWVRPMESIYQSSLAHLTPIACLTNLVSATPTSSVIDVSP